MAIVNQFCGARTRYVDPNYKPVPVPPQTVRCVRNRDHPGLHYGAAQDVDGDIVLYQWNDDEGTKP